MNKSNNTPAVKPAKSATKSVAITFTPEVITSLANIIAPVVRIKAELVKAVETLTQSPAFKDLKPKEKAALAKPLRKELIETHKLDKRRVSETLIELGIKAKESPKKDKKKELDAAKLAQLIALSDELFSEDSSIALRRAYLKKIAKQSS